jgi:hypothetical protein
LYAVTKVAQLLGRRRRTMVFGSHSEQVGMDFGISVLLRPEIERDRGKFVDGRRHRWHGGAHTVPPALTVALGPIIVWGKFGVLSFGLSFEVVDRKPERIRRAEGRRRTAPPAFVRAGHEGQHDGKITGTIRAQPKLSWHNSPKPEFEVGIPAWKGTLCRRK